MKQTSKNQVLKGLIYAEEKIDKRIELLRVNDHTTEENKKRFRKKKIRNLFQIVKKFGFVKTIFGSMTGLITTTLMYLEKNILFELSQTVSPEVLLILVVFLAIMSLWSINMNLNQSTLRRVGDLDDELFDRYYFQETQKTQSDMLTILAQEGYAFSDARRYIESQGNEEEMYHLMKSWQKERERYRQEIEKERLKVDRIVEEQTDKMQELFSKNRKEFIPMKETIMFRTKLQQQFKRKMETYLKGNLTLSTLNFIGGYTVYKIKEVEGNLYWVPKASSGLRRRSYKTIDVYDKRQIKRPIVKMIIEDESEDFFKFENKKLSMIFETINGETWAIEIEVEKHAFQLINQNDFKDLNIDVLYDYLDICLNLISDRKGVISDDQTEYKKEDRNEAQKA